MHHKIQSAAQLHQILTSLSKNGVYGGTVVDHLSARVACEFLMNSLPFGCQWMGLLQSSFQLHAIVQDSVGDSCRRLACRDIHPSACLHL